MNSREENFIRLYVETKDKVYRLCLGFMGNSNDADDLFQEILIKVWLNLDSFRNESKVDTWIYRIASNTALLQLNRIANKNKKLSAIHLAIEEQLSLAKPVSVDKNKINKLYQSISTLKEIDRIIISLVLEGCQYTEIAEITGVTVSNVGVRINRIKKSLSKLMVR